MSLEAGSFPELPERSAALADYVKDTHSHAVESYAAGEGQARYDRLLSEENKM